MTRPELVAVVQGLALVLREYLAVTAQRLAALEAKERGLDGARGQEGPEGKPGRDGRDGLPGWPGEKGQNGQAGTDGKPGRDGTLDNLKVIRSEDGRTVTLCYKDGTPIEGGVLRFPIVLDRGIYHASKGYDQGDGVSWAGSFWIAQAATSEKPGEGATSWRLAVKRGGEGKTGPDGKPGLNGKDGAPGKDGNRTW